jgi:hypothetical protein
MDDGRDGQAAIAGRRRHLLEVENVGHTYKLLDSLVELAVLEMPVRMQQPLHPSPWAIHVDDLDPKVARGRP